MAYPVSVVVEPRLVDRDRLTTGLRLILALPHSVLVGPIYWLRYGAAQGFIGAAAYFMAIVSWFTILINGEHYTGIREFSLYYLRWRVRAVAYLALFTDAYPPFGDAPYPATIAVVDPVLPRDRASVAVRLLVALPHLVLLFFLGIAWLLVSIAAWLSIVFTGEYPAAVYPFGVGVMRWLLRVEAYLLLLVDEYPPFTLE